jgi:hypothetical protein
MLCLHERFLALIQSLPDALLASLHILDFNLPLDELLACLPLIAFLK